VQPIALLVIQEHFIIKVVAKLRVPMDIGQGVRTIHAKHVIAVVQNALEP
jgi:hypothetical protein